MKKLGLIALISLLLISCGNNKQKTNDDAAESAVKTEDSSVKYAKYLNIKYFDDYTAVKVLDPWQDGAIIGIYYLVSDTAVQVPSDGCVIKVPVEQIALNSCAHLGFTDQLGCIDRVIGMASSKYVYNPALLQRIKNGTCTDIGDAFDMNFEKIATLPIQAIVVTKYNGSDKNIERLQTTGIPVIYNVEWMEPNILGRAEWIKLFGVLFGEQAKADSIFDEICERYRDLKALAADVETRPSVMAGMPYKGTWYMPAGNNYMSGLFVDAGADYKYSNTDGYGSLPLSLETIMVDFEQADVWVGTDVNTLAEIETADNRLTLFKAFKTGKVFNQRKRSNNNGGNDFWETGVARPDILLQDLMIIFHPELFSGDETYFMEKLK